MAWPALEPLETDLAPDERDQLLDKAAQEVVRRRLEFPAILALEMHRPLAFLGSQVAIVATPMVAPLAGLRNMQILTQLLQDRENVDRLLERIEELSAAREQTLAHGEEGAA